MREKEVNVEIIEQQSTSILRVSYDHTTAVLTINFIGSGHGGSQYEYYGVEYVVFERFTKAVSLGKYFHAHIRNKYMYKRIE